MPTNRDLILRQAQEEITPFFDAAGLHKVTAWRRFNYAYWRSLDFGHKMLGGNLIVIDVSA